MKNSTELWRKAREVGVTIFNLSNFNGNEKFRYIILNPDGSLCCYFYDNDSENEYDNEIYVELEPDDLENTIEVTVAKYLKRFEDEEQKLIETIRERQRIEAENIEKQELAIYYKLKRKFETLNNN